MAVAEREITREQWLEDRRTYLGATDIAAILGVDSHKTPLDVYNEKLGLVAPFAGNQQTKRGQKLEAVAAQEYSEATGRKLHKRSMTLTHPKHEFIRGHLDRRVVGGDKRPVEIKCPSRGMFHKIQREGLPDPWILQMQTYLWLDGSEVGDFAPFCADLFEILPFEVHAQPEIFAQIEDAAVRFWQNHVLPAVPPRPIDADKPKLEFAKVAGKVLQMDSAEFLEAAELLKDAKQLEQDGKDLYEIAKDRIKGIVGGYGKFEGGDLRLHYSQQAGRKSLDRKALEAAHPKLDLTPFERQGAPFEVFKPYWGAK